MVLFGAIVTAEYYETPYQKSKLRVSLAVYGTRSGKTLLDVEKRRHLENQPR